MLGKFRTIAASIVLATAAIAPQQAAQAAQVSAQVSAHATPRLLAVRKELGAPPAGVSDLKFHDIFKTPVGDKGLEPSTALLALAGKRVRMVGYMVRQQPAPKDTFLLSPLAAEISDEDEPLADDLPPSIVAIEVTGAANQPIPLLPGLIQVTGVLHVGAKTDTASGRVSAVQIALDAPVAKALLGSNSAPAKPTRAGAR